MLGAIAIAACSILPLTDEPVWDRCEVIERNVVYTDAGCVCFKQFIFWDRSGHVRAWRMDKGARVERDYKRDEFVLRFVDGEAWREIRAPHFVEIHSQYDREIEERSRLPKDRRRELTKP